MESLLSTLYSQLHVQPDLQHALLLTRHVQDPVTDAERFVQVSALGYWFIVGLKFQFKISVDSLLFQNRKV